MIGIQTLQTQDTGTSARLSIGQIGTGADVSTDSLQILIGDSIIHTAVFPQ